MILVKTPYRISLGGGGTDLPFYAREKGGKLISATIDQHVLTIIAKRQLDNKILVQSTDVQFANNLNSLNNKIIREVLRYFKVYKSIQIATISSLQTGIGLGSSSSLIVGLVKGISTLNGIELSKMEIGHIAHHIERVKLKFEGGIQDQYIAALGEVQTISIDTSGVVSASPLIIDDNIKQNLENNLVIIFTGLERDSHKIIKSQKIDKIKTIDVYDQIKQIGIESINLIRNADIETLGKAMDKHWCLKKSISNKMSNNRFDEMYIKLKNLGSPGGKIMGAGGGGFFLMAVPENVEMYKKKVLEYGYHLLDWKFENNGTEII